MVLSNLEESRQGEAGPAAFRPHCYSTLSEMQTFLRTRDRIRAEPRQIEAAGAAVAACRLCRPAVGAKPGDDCACYLMARERAALHLLMGEFDALAGDMVALAGGPQLAAAVAAASFRSEAFNPSSPQTDEAAEADHLLLADPAVAGLAARHARAWLSRLRPGGGLILALGTVVPPAESWGLLEQVRRAGFTGVTLLDAWSPAFGYVGDDLLFIRAQRPGAAPRQRGIPAEPPPVPATAPVRPASAAARSPVSVVIPLYNHQTYIEAALDSVFRQTRPPAEVIVIDDGSSDCSAEVAERVCAGYDGAVFWKHPNRGAHNTINTGLHRATQPLLAILNSDDLFHPRRLEQCLATLERTGSTIAATRIDFINESDERIANPWYEKVVGRWHEIGNTSLALLNGNFLMTTSNLVVHRRVFEDVGHFRNFRYAHDLEFFVRALGGGHQIVMVDEVLLDYRYHPGNTIKENHTKVRAEWAFIIASVMRHVPDQLLETLDRWEYLERLNWIAHSHQLTTGILLMLEAMFAASPADAPDISFLTTRPGLLERVYRSLG